MDKINKTAVENNQSGFTRKAALTVLVLVFFITALSLSLVYFFVQRPSDSDYQKISTEIEILKTNSRDLQAGLPIIQYPDNITTNVSTKIKSIADNYQGSLSSLEGNIVLKNDTTTQAIYLQNKSILDNFAKSSKSLSDSIGFYVKILDSCSDFTTSINKNETEKYNILLTDCEKAIDDSKSSTDKNFNDQFFTEYRDETAIYIAAVKNFDSIDKTTASKAKTTMDQAYAMISALGNKSIEYSLPDPTDALNKLSAIADSQKKALFR